MAKLLKILGLTLGSLVEWSLILIIVLAFAIRTSPVQTYFAGQATNYLSRELGAEVKVDKVAIVFFDRVALDGVLIKDQSGDTLIYAKRIIATLDEISLAKKKFTVSSAHVKNAYVHIQRSKDNVFNHAFIKEYFIKDKKKKNKIKFKLLQGKISDSRFRYDDHRKGIRETGMDYFHLSASNINGSLSNIQVKKDVITAKVDWINLEEKCGFKLNDLNTNAEISPRGVLLSDLELKTDDSHVKSEKLNMISKSYNCFKYFVDSVSFDGKINESDVSLKDVAYFAYTLDGMTDQVRVQTEIKKKITDLKLKNLDLRYKDKSRIKGTINLDDYREIEEGFFHEKLNYIYLDIKEIKSLRLPNSSSSHYLSISPEIERLKFIEANSITLDGMYSEFVVAAKYIETGLGGAHLDNGILFTANEENSSYMFEQSHSSNYDVKVDNFNLGTYTGNSSLGLIDGELFLAGEIFSASNIVFNKITGEVNRFDFLDYPYQHISIERGSYMKKKFDGRIEINDKNLELVYDGSIDMTGNRHMDFNVDIKRAVLDSINIASTDSKLITSCQIDLKGKDLNSFDGTVKFAGTSYETGGKILDVDYLDLDIERKINDDHFEIASSAGEATIDGQIDFNHITQDFNQLLNRVLPALYDHEFKETYTNVDDHFTFHVKLDKANDFLDVFYPDLKIAPETTLDGHYDSKQSEFDVTVISHKVNYGNFQFDELKMYQELDSNNIFASYDSDRLAYKDSLDFNNIHFETTGGNDELFHIIEWDRQTDVESEISWETFMHSYNHHSIHVNPSHFFIKDLKWDISHESNVNFHGDTISVNNFELSRDHQDILINGLISDQDEDKLNFEITDLELGEISRFITSEYPMTGLINSKGYITNPFHNLDFYSTGSLTFFEVKNQHVGDINVRAVWNKEKQSIKTSGDLTYIDEKTFDFVGDYYIFEDENNIDFDLNFDNTNLQFTNAFMDPDVMSEIRGFLQGKIDLTGSINEPILEGGVNLAAGSAYLDILGVHVGVDGEIEVDEYGFYINGIPVFDEDGKAGLLVGAVFHENFKDFNFDLQFDLEPTSDYAENFGGQGMDKFLVMDLPYSHDGLYYGKGYVTGMANIFGYTDNLEITVDFKTEKGTIVNIPMYGVGEIEEEDFISFVSHATLDSVIAVPKYDLSGVVIDLNFEVTKDADINIIFNEELGDVISARGKGDIAISLDDVGDVKMEGVYTVDNGEYNFAMDPLNQKSIAFKQKFIIERGGNISWTGDPYDAELNLRTYYELNANIAEISNDQFGSGKGAHQPVLSYLDLSGSMTTPAIGFDIQAPQADETGRTLINRIKSDNDELSRQFFSLMLFRRFQPIDMDNSRSGSGALDLISNQINYMLAAVSTEYNLNLDFDTDQLTGDNTLEFGVSKGFLDDRLIFSGSFGVENYGKDAHITDKDGNELEGQIIGDVSLEYLLNESGTFRVNIFNESTDKTVIQEGNLGDFTQGAGLNYSEDFNSFKDFKLIQYVFDVFRKKENKRYPNKRKRQQRLVPEDSGTEEEPEPTTIIEGN